MPQKKLEWEIYRERLDGSGISMAELVRRTRGEFSYDRARGFFNGYWGINAKEKAAIDRVFANCNPATAE